ERRDPCVARCDRSCLRYDARGLHVNGTSSLVGQRKLLLGFEVEIDDARLIEIPGIDAFDRRINRLPSTGPFHCKLERTLRGAEKSLAKRKTLGAALANTVPLLPSAQVVGIADRLLTYE